MKKSLSGLFALAIAICAVAFTAPKEIKRTDAYWFSYSNNVVVPILSTEPTHSSNPFTCSSGSFICTKSFLPGDTETYTESGTGLIKRRPKTGVSEDEVFFKNVQ